MSIGCQWGRFFLTHPKILIKKRIFFNRKGGRMINIDADAIFYNIFNCNKYNNLFSNGIR